MTNIEYLLKYCLSNLNQLKEEEQLIVLTSLSNIVNSVNDHTYAILLDKLVSPIVTNIINIMNNVYFTSICSTVSHHLNMLSSIIKVIDLDNKNITLFTSLSSTLNQIFLNIFKFISIYKTSLTHMQSNQLIEVTISIIIFT